jgi:hypothetical protein
MVGSTGDSPCAARSNGPETRRDHSHAAAICFAGGPDQRRSPARSRILPAFVAAANRGSRLSVSAGSRLRPMDPTWPVFRSEIFGIRLRRAAVEGSWLSDRSRHPGTKRLRGWETRLRSPSLRSGVVGKDAVRNQAGLCLARPQKPDIVTHDGHPMLKTH